MQYYGKEEREALSHHGILGMHWGDRNGPPYPLGSGDHSASEKKAGWRKSLRSIRNRANSRFIKRVTSQKKYIEPKKERNNKWGDEVFSGKIVSRKKIDIGQEKTEAILKVVGAAAITGLVVYGAYKLDKKTNLRPLSILNTMESRGLSLDPALSSLIQRGKIADTDIPNLFNRKQWESLSYEQKGALTFYTSSEGFTLMNGTLRNTLSGLFRNSPFYPQRHEMIKQATSALEVSKLDRQITTFRGCGFNALDGLFGGTKVSKMSNKEMQQFIGAEITEKGFFSTSPAGIPLGFKSNVDITICCPKGTKGLYIGPESKFPYEKELILQRNSTFRVLSMTKQSDETVNLVLEVIKQVIDEEIRL